MELTVSWSSCCHHHMPGAGGGWPQWRQGQMSSDDRKSTTSFKLGSLG